MQYMDINGFSVPYPNSLELQRVPNIVNEITTLTGKVVADVNGWRYGDTTLQWDTLLNQDLENLLTAISVSSFPVTFNDIDGVSHTVNAVLKGRANVKTPIFEPNAVLWRDVSISLSFPDCYEEE